MSRLLTQSSVPKTNQSTSKKKSIWIVPLVIVLASSIFFIYAFSSMLSQNQAVADYKAIDGEIVEHQEIFARTSNNTPITRYAEVIAYEVDGDRYRLVSNVQSTNPKPIGAHRQVLYNPANPEQAILSGFFTNPLNISMILSGMLIVLGTIMLIRNVREK